MSEYWVSTPKYWCKHCTTFVVDSPLGRKNHDSTAKHQQALKRFLRDLHRTNEREANASESAKREVARLNALVDGSGSGAALKGPAPSVAKAELKKGERWGFSQRPASEAERQRQMKELEALGVALPDTHRADLALPGEWTTVSIEQGKTTKEEDEAAKMQEYEKAQEALEKKRRWEAMDQDEKALRGFQIETKKYPGMVEDDGEGMDVKDMFGKRKAKTEPNEEQREAVRIHIKKEDEVEVKREIPDVEAEVEPVQTEVSEGSGVKKEEEEEANAIPTEVAAAVVFKKRKVKSIRKK